jgi:hypothetical protein
MSKMSKEIIDNISAETRWTIAGQNWTGGMTYIGMMLEPILGMEKWQGIMNEFWAGGGKMMFPQMKEAFNIEVKDAIGGYKLLAVVASLPAGPEFEDEMIEVTPERVVWRTRKCAWMERAKEFGVDLKTMTCPAAHQLWGEEGLKAVDPRFTHKMTKWMPKGDPYCENIIEFKK